jgi:hypothetical protein
MDAVAKEMCVCITTNMMLEYNVLRVWTLKVALNSPANLITSEGHIYSPKVSCTRIHEVL